MASGIQEMSVLLRHPSFALKMCVKLRHQARVSHSPEESWGFGSHMAGRRGSERGTLAPDLGAQGSPRANKVASGLVRCNQAKRGLQGLALAVPGRSLGHQFLEGGDHRPGPPRPPTVFLLLQELQPEPRSPCDGSVLVLATAGLW